MKASFLLSLVASATGPLLGQTVTATVSAATALTTRATTNGVNDFQSLPTTAAYRATAF